MYFIFQIFYREYTIYINVKFIKQNIKNFIKTKNVLFRKKKIRFKIFKNIKYTFINVLNALLLLEKNSYVYIHTICFFLKYKT